MACEPPTAKVGRLKEGLLWQDAGDADLASKVGAAAQRYQDKFGVEADTCHVNPGMLPKHATTPRRVGNIKVLGDPSILPNHFWVGVAGKGGQV